MANSQYSFGIRSCYLENIRFGKCSIRLTTSLLLQYIKCDFSKKSAKSSRFSPSPHPPPPSPPRKEHTCNRFYHHITPLKLQSNLIQGSHWLCAVMLWNIAEILEMTWMFPWLQPIISRGVPSWPCLFIGAALFHVRGRYAIACYTYILFECTCLGSVRISRYIRTSSSFWLLIKTRCASRATVMTSRWVVSPEMIMVSNVEEFMLAQL